MTDREGALKLCLFGDNFTGRTTLVNMYLTKVFDEDIKTTVGVDFYVKDLEIDGKNIVIRIWNFGGEQRFKVLLPSFAKGADGGIFVFDLTRYTSLKNIDDWLSIFEKNYRMEIPIMMVGVLTDETLRSVTAEEALKIAKSRNLKGYVECTLKTGKNFENTLEVLTRLMLKRVCSTNIQKKPISNFLIPIYFKINDHSPRFLKNLVNWFNHKIPKYLTNRIMGKLNNLHCPYCGNKVGKTHVHVLKGKN
jgi:small GTP-binding protein